MMQITPVGKRGGASRVSCLMNIAGYPSLNFVATFRDDPSIWEGNVLGAASGDHCDWGMQPQTLLDAHGQEG